MWPTIRGMEETAEWQLSSKRYPTPELAAQDACHWLAINGENGCFVAVRLKHLPTEGVA
jgi:hypothetical protein